MNDAPKSQIDSNELADYTASTTSRRMLEPVLLFEASRLQESLSNRGKTASEVSAPIMSLDS